MGNTCNNCGGDLLKCTHPQETPVKTKTITVEPEDAKPGDKVTGTYTRVKDVHVEASGVLKGGSFGDHELYLVASWAYVVVHGGITKDWQDVTITREVPVQTRIGWLKDLPVGTWFKTPNGGAHFVKISDDRIDRLDSGHIMSYPITTHYFGNAEFRDGDYKILEPEVKS